MYKLIGENNKVNYGCIDEPIEWNYEDFVLRDFFNRQVPFLKKKAAYHQFNYIGISVGDYVSGFALVDLGAVKNVFGFLYKTGDGLLLEFDEKCPGFSRKMDFPRNPDSYVARYKGRRIDMSVKKDLVAGILSFSCSYQDRFAISGRFPYSFEGHRPLRVLNPNDPNRFTFTEKCSPLIAEDFELILRKEKIPFGDLPAVALYDWSGGYLRRETIWYWTAFGAVLPDGTSLGANLAAFVNETYFSENAFWINHERTRLSRVIYDMDSLNPYREWHIYNEEGTIELSFAPEGERSDKINGGPLAKAVFRQFIGSFSGYVRTEKDGKIEFSKVKGFCEIHRALW